MKIFMVLIALLLGGCAAFEDTGERPIGTGGGRDEFPRSPCACGEPFYRAGKPV